MRAIVTVNVRQSAQVYRIKQDGAHVLNLSVTAYADLMDNGRLADTGLTPKTNGLPGLETDV
jgi:hypothetical protein